MTRVSAGLPAENVAGWTQDDESEARRTGKLKLECGALRAGVAIGRRLNSPFLAAGS